jgi:N-acyl homoserine lactone hydrolase
MKPGEWLLESLHLDTVTYPDWHPRFGEDGPVYVYLLRNDERSILVDTGIGPVHPGIDKLYEPTRGDLTKALAEHGVELADISAVVLSHVHFDHVGGAHVFPGVPLYVQRAEWEAAQAPKYTIREFLAFAGANFVLIDGDLELAPGLRLIATMDHTPGHQVVAVQTSDGLVVLAGQAIEMCAELEAMLANEVWNGPDYGLREQRLEAAQRLLALDPARIRFSHDHRAWER